MSNANLLRDARKKQALESLLTKPAKAMRASVSSNWRVTFLGAD